MRVLGLDPGSRYTGWGILNRSGSRLTPVAHGRIVLPQKKPLALRLGILHREVVELLDRWEPETAALESLFHGVNTRSLIVLAQARGALLATLGGRIEVAEYSPSEIKSAVTGSGRADKEQVARMVAMILGLRDVKMSPDESDALAIAICLAQRAKLDGLQGKGS